MKRFIPLVILVTSPLLMCAESYEQTLDSGHIGPVLSLAWDRERGLLFSGGQDGTLRVWQNRPFRLLRKIQVSDLPVRRMELNPRRPEIALVLSDGNNRHVLRVLDWKRAKTKFSADLPQVPLALEFSPLGSFVVVGKTDWNSLTFFDADTGGRIAPLREGFGIVSFLLISASENTLVSYTPSSGSFTYWDLKSGERKQTVRSSPELRNLRALSSRHAAGTLGEDLVVVDLVTGSVLASSREEGVYDLSVGPQGRIATMAAQRDRTVLQSWVFEGPGNGSLRGGLLRRASSPRPVPGEPADLVLADDGVYTALRDGSIGLAEGEDLPIRIGGRNRLDRVTDLAAEEGVLRLVTPERILSFASDFFTSDDDGDATKLTVTAAENPFRASAGILRGARGDYFLWLREPDRPGRIVRIDFASGLVLSRFDSFSLPLSAVLESEGFLYCLERNGSIKKIETSGMGVSFEYPAWGIHTMVPLENRNILAGSAGVFSSPLVSINATTGETVSLDAPPLQLVFAVDYDPRDRQVYFAGLETDADGGTATKLYRADRNRTGNATVLASHPGLDIDADIHIDPVSSDVYTTLGNTLRGWNGARWRSFDSGNGIPLLLRDLGRLLFGINADGSVSVWEKKSGRLSGTIYVLQDGNWVVVARDGRYLASHGEGVKVPLTALGEEGALSEEEEAGLRLFPEVQP